MNLVDRMGWYLEALEDVVAGPVRSRTGAGLRVAVDGALWEVREPFTRELLAVVASLERGGPTG